MVAPRAATLEKADSNLLQGMLRRLTEMQKETKSCELLPHTSIESVSVNVWLRGCENVYRSMNVYVCLCECGCVCVCLVEN